MAYRLKKGESVPEGIKRVVIEEIESATEQLDRATSRTRGKAIHEARKSLKKIRGVLRLMRPELGGVYKDENTKLRDLGRKLSEIRDAQAIIDTFDGIVDQNREAVSDKSFSSIGRGLERSKRDTERAANVESVIRHTSRALRSAIPRVRRWPLSQDGFRVISPGLERTYRLGRKAMRKAQRQPTPENYHALRKRVKDHWYHVRLLESLWTEVMQAREASLKDLETWLGEDHNLVVLCEKVRTEPDRFGNGQATELFFGLAAKEQKEFREKAMSVAERVYEEKPGQFVRRISELWHAWQHQPEVMTEVQKEARNSRPKKGSATRAGREGSAA